MKTKNSNISPIKVLFIVVVTLFSLAAYSCSTDCEDSTPTPMPDSTASIGG
jgi:hypothetical protein